MIDKSKMSVADILAAARKADGGDGSGSSPSPPQDTEKAPAEGNGDMAASSTSAAVEGQQQPTDSTAAINDGPKAPPAKVPASGAGRPSVADILAAARGEKSGGTAVATPAKPKAAPKPSAPKPAAAKPAAAKSKPQPKKSEPLDTQSILAAARISRDHRPGPMSKAEAAAKGKPVQPKAKAPKEKIVVPPMPVKPDYAKAPAQQRSKEEKAQRRAFLFGLSALAVGFAALSATGFLWAMGTLRFMFPNILREPPSRFKVGFPDQIAPGQVETKFKAQFGVWIVNTEYNGEQQIYALKSVCTHLGCTPNWLEAEQKFKCPCHGSGFYKDGINFEGPAPRPLERYAISVANDGQIQVDKSRVFQEEMGQWSEPASYIPV